MAWVWPQEAGLRAEDGRHVRAFVIVDPTDNFEHIGKRLRDNGIMPVLIFTNMMRYASKERAEANKIVGMMDSIPHSIATGLVFGRGFSVFAARRNMLSILEVLANARYAFAEEGYELEFVGLGADNEMGVDHSDWLAASLGLPCNPVASARARRDKAEMKEAVERAGLVYARYARVSEAADVSPALAKTGLPAVVKTPAGAGTNMVSVARSEAEVAAAAQRVISTPDLFGRLPTFALVEEYVEGPEYAVNMIASPERVATTDVWRYEKHTDAATGAVLYDEATLETDVGAPLWRRLSAYGAAVARAVRVRGDGEPVMMEIAARFSGGYKPDMAARLIPGWDPWRAFVESRLRGTGWGSWPAEGAFRPRGAAKHLFFHLDREGEVAAVHGVPEIEALPTYWRHDLHKACRPGSFMPRTTSYLDYPLHVYLVSETPDAAEALREVERDAAAARRLFRVEFAAAAQQQPPPRAGVVPSAWEARREDAGHGAAKAAAAAGCALAGLGLLLRRRPVAAAAAGAAAWTRAWRRP
eukprot:tig00021719_g23163.t1